MGEAPEGVLSEKMMSKTKSGTNIQGCEMLHNWDVSMRSNFRHAHHPSKPPLCPNGSRTAQWIYLIGAIQPPRIATLDQLCDTWKATSQVREEAQAPCEFPAACCTWKGAPPQAHIDDSSRLTYKKEHGGCWVDEPPRPVGDYCRNQDTARDGSGDDQWPSRPQALHVWQVEPTGLPAGGEE